MEIKTRNVNTAFAELVRHFHGATTYNNPAGGCHAVFKNVRMAATPSRNGPCVRVDEPVTVTYSHPAERVLFHPLRDANPFFHVYEALWMLAGRDDVEPVAYYAKNMRDFSDDGKTFNGAYGRRWRRSRVHTPEDRAAGKVYHVDLDQLCAVVKHLKADPASRRAVVQMWSADEDLQKVGPRDTDMPYSKDVCCNLSAMFALRKTGGIAWQAVDIGDVSGPDAYALDMTVANRSNDLVWGMLGANCVHFTFLQEYLAARLGVEVGLYHHFSNNLHVYTERHGEKLADWVKWYGYDDPRLPADRYGQAGLNTSTMATNLEWATSVPFDHVALVRDPAAFDDEVKRFVEYHSGPAGKINAPCWSEPFLKTVAHPMCRAFHLHKTGDRGGAMIQAERVAAADWRFAAVEWLRRRYDK